MSKFSKILSSAAMLALIASPIATFPTEGWSQVGTIVVTTRKREENLQDIPISVSTFGLQDIQQRGLQDVLDIGRISPSVIVDEGFGPASNAITIRGLSQTRGRPSVAVLVDGIDVTSESVQFAGGGAFITQRLLDIERIEIVKGPQSALYGRSAFNGAIQYVTRDPSLEEFEAHGAFDFGNKGRYSVNGGVSGPVADTFAVAINGNYWSEDGFYDHPATGEDIDGGDGWGISGTALWEPNDQFRFKARVAYADDEYDTQPQSTLRTNTTASPPAAACVPVAPAVTAALSSCGPVSLRSGLLPDGEGLLVTTSLDPRTGLVYPGSERELFSASLAAEWDLDTFTVSSWTGFTDVQNNFFNDGDFDAVFSGPIGSQIEISPRGQEHDFMEDVQQISQELRVASNFDGPFQVTVGGLYWQEKVDQSGNSKFSTALFGLPPMTSATDAFPFFDDVRNTVERDETHWSAYAMVEWDITDQFKITAETRYGRDKVTVVGVVHDFAAPVSLGGVTTTCPFFGFPSLACDLFGEANDAIFGTLPPGDMIVEQPPTLPFPVTTKEDYFAPRFSLEWTPTDDLLLYFSAARGIKPGGISTVTAGTFIDADLDGTAAEFIVLKEKLWSYEGGVKATWMDGTLLTNLAVFYQSYKDKQVSSRRIFVTGTPPTGILLNAGAARVWGVEFEGLWQPDDHWTFGAGYTYLNTRYTEFDELSTSATAVVREGNCTVITIPGDMRNSCLIDHSGNQLEKAPKHAASFSARYTHPLFDTGWDWFLEGNGIYQGKRFVEEANHQQFDSYWMADFRTGISTEQWQILFYVDNAFNDLTIKDGSNSGGDVETGLTNPFSFSRPTTLSPSCRIRDAGAFAPTSDFSEFNFPLVLFEYQDSPPG